MTPETTTQRVAAYLAEHPGVEHRAFEVARALGLSNHQAATTLRRLWEQGRIDRLRVTLPGGSGPSHSLYGTPDGLIRPSRRKRGAR